MIYDGAIKFSRQAIAAIDKRDWEAMYNGLIRAQKIVLELQNSLKPEIQPDLCDKLTALYTYMYRRLVDANLERDTTPVNEVINLLNYERETWVMVMKKLDNGEGDQTTLADRAAARPHPAPTNPLGRIGPEGYAPQHAAAAATGTEDPAANRPAFNAEG